MEKNILKQKRKLGLSIGIFMIVINAISYLSSFLLVKFDLVTEQNQYVLSYVVNAINIYVIGYAVFKLALRKVECVEKKEKQKLKLTEILLLMCVTVGGAQFVNIITQIILLAIKALLHTDINNNVADMIENSNPIATFIFAALLGPIFEELIFRGTLLKRLRVYGDKTAIIYTAIAFGLFHTNINQIPFAITCGLVLGYSMVRTNNIKWPIFLHIFMNSISVVLSILLKFDLTIPMFIVELLIMISIILTLVFVPIKLSTGKVKVSNESKYDKKNLYKNAGYIFTLVLIVIITVIEAFI